MKNTHRALTDFGSAFFGPAFNSYARAIEAEAPEHLPVCLAREGWAIYQLLSKLHNEKVIDLPTSPVYLRVSRTLLFRALFGDPLLWSVSLKTDFRGTFRELLQKRFGILTSEISSSLPGKHLDKRIRLPDDKHKAIQLLEESTPRLKPFTETTRKTFVKYLASLQLNSHPHKPLLLDVGYSGTIQTLLTHLLERDTKGLYFIANNPGDNTIGNYTATMKGIFREDIAWGEGYAMLERSLFLESLMTAPHGQTLNVKELQNNQFQFFYGRHAAPQRYAQDLKTIIASGIQTAADSIRQGVVYSPDEIEAMYTTFACKSGAIPCSTWHLFSVDDDFSGHGMINPLQLFAMS